jgi:hypothetical protein
MATKKVSKKTTKKTSDTAAHMEKYNYIMANVKCPSKDKVAWWAKFKETCKKNE